MTNNAGNDKNGCAKKEKKKKRKKGRKKSDSANSFVMSSNSFLLFVFGFVSNVIE